MVQRHPLRAALPLVTAGLFVLLSLLNVVFMIRGPWPGYTRGTVPVEILMIGVWIAAAIGSVLRKGWGYVAALLGAISAVAHGAVLRLGEAPVGVVFLVAGFALLGLVVAEHREFGLSAAGTRPSIA